MKELHPKILRFVDEYGITDRARNFLSTPHEMFINGRFVAARGANRIDTFEPSTGEVLSNIPLGQDEHVDAVVQAAKSAFEGSWSKVTPADRERILQRIADLVDEHSQTIAEIESIDNGKAVSGAREVDVLGGSALLRYMAGWPTKLEGSTRSVSLDGEHLGFTLLEPVGPVAAIVPWNWPFNMAIWKIAAPLAAGCTVVIKPSELTPLSVLYFADLCTKAGLPDGVLNVVLGDGATVGSRLVRHPDIKKVSFTGSTRVGKIVGAEASGNLKHVTLELGGKSPMIAFKDANIEKLAESTLQSIFFNSGQVCSAGSRLYIHESIYEETLDAVARVATGLKIAPGLDPDCDMGPVISQKQKESIEAYVELARKEGGRIVCGGNPIDGRGFFVGPTLIADTNNEMRVVQEEIFGPVLVAQSFTSEADALALANDNAYGLAASIWTNDISKAIDATKRLQAGTVWVNNHDLVDVSLPFGGVKDSGIGKDLGPEQLRQYLNTKTALITVL